MTIGKEIRKLFERENKSNNQHTPLNKEVTVPPYFAYEVFRSITTFGSAKCFFAGSRSFG